MIPYPRIRPEIVRIGPIALRWYGLMYVLGFIAGFHILKARIRAGFFKIPLERADSFISYLVVGMLLGARLVYVFVYNWDYYSLRPVEVFYIWQGGLSFHGAAIGMIVASFIFARNMRVPVYSALDTLAIGSCIGLTVGRLGNFINGELYGRVTDLPWAMIFPTDPKQLPRHPSQIYQSLTEGLGLFLVLSLVHRRMAKSGRYRDGVIGTCFVAGYGISRFFMEFTREPDAQLGFVFSIFSMGQVLCFLMILASLGMWWHGKRTSEPHAVSRKPILPPEKLDFFDRYVFWPLERFLARFVA